MSDYSVVEERDERRRKWKIGWFQTMFKVPDIYAEIVESTLKGEHKPKPRFNLYFDKKQVASTYWDSGNHIDVDKLIEILNEFKKMLAKSERTTGL